MYCEIVRGQVTFSTKNATYWELLEKGGNSKVFRSTDCQHALKVTPVIEGDFSGPLTEGFLLTRTNHPYLVQATDFGRLSLPNNQSAIGVEMPHFYRDLQDAWEELTLPEFLFSMQTALGGLSYLHSIGVAHSDLKPENIFLNEESVGHIGDLGICFVNPDKSPFWSTLPAIMQKRLLQRWEQERGMGTPEYMAPEQARSLLPSPRSDVSSMGQILFKYLTRRHFHPGETRLGIAGNAAAYNASQWPDRVSKLDYGVMQQFGIDTKVWHAYEKAKIGLAMTLNPDPKARPSARKLRQIIRKFRRGVLEG